MKSTQILLTVLLAVFIAGKANSQLSIVIFSEKGEKFTAYVNGSPRNDKPASRVETDRPGGPTFKLRILFEDSSFPEISKSIFNTPGPDLFYVILKNEKGKFVLEKTSSEYIHTENTDGKEVKSTKDQEKPKTEPVKSEAKPTVGSSKGCNDPMEEPNFIASREMISNAPFDGPKLSNAKKLADEHCLKTLQIIDVIYLFSGESSRLNFAKYAYKHCWDPGNYDQVKEALRSSSQGDLQQYIETLK
jgi:hypothetical protein